MLEDRWPMGKSHDPDRNRYRNHPVRNHAHVRGRVPCHGHVPEVVGPVRERLIHAQGPRHALQGRDRVALHRAHGRGRDRHTHLTIPPKRVALDGHRKSRDTVRGHR